ncbi:hypothetical protein CRG98_000644 [Punica granatum]|uniref:Uncharacterized protein n=1 Tax=Punica granatum TaxID=22663 RepID=A0A2I0LE92_PUNGR|nr:hypothetical protein CRG98_000644 [Punica granatum]
MRDRIRPSEPLGFLLLSLGFFFILIGFRVSCESNQVSGEYELRTITFGNSQGAQSHPAGSEKSSEPLESPTPPLGPFSFQSGLCQSDGPARIAEWPNSAQRPTQPSSPVQLRPVWPSKPLGPVRISKAQFSPSAQFGPLPQQPNSSGEFLFIYRITHRLPELSKFPT